MLSRRNIRTKLLQVLYAHLTNGLTDKETIDYYRDQWKDTYLQFKVTLVTLYEITKFAKEDADKRSQKHIKSSMDSDFSDVFHTNPLVQSIGQLKCYKQVTTSEDYQNIFQIELHRKLYHEFSKTDEYFKYVFNKNRDYEAHINILLGLYKWLLTQEIFVEMMEELNPRWNDDETLITGAMKKAIKALPLDENYMKTQDPDPEVTDDFGEFLLVKILENHTDIESIIHSHLENWDPKRVALIDMVILKIAIGEFLYCETIPPKVTLNEAVEIAKAYSTEKSKEFVNGVLDKALRTLSSADRISKKGRGLVNE